MTTLPARCSPTVHHWFATEEQVRAVAHAKSVGGKFYSHRKCPACTGWRLARRA